ncbi:c-type cytochrome [Caballeronia insecticola]|uniref:Gluconate 2-dehydrogenase n=1 Tax=Caballeronia insecticola TaxID=758793 RepID=R4X137_9BURK|nr:c-type cytochrome [Caballeronia insecticola]BAN28030.1 gluconate 2-dehydrogenase [Caballeronia insecticola]
MNDMSDLRVCEIATLAACVIVDIDDDIATLAARMSLDAGVSWIAAGSMGAFVADEAQHAFDAARRLAAALAQPDAEASAIVTSRERLPHEKRYTWPLFDDALHACDVLARDDGTSIELRCATSDAQQLCAQLAHASGLPATRFAIRATSNIEDESFVATLAAVMLLHRTGRAVHVRGVMSARETKDVRMSLGASLDEAGHLNAWRYDADTGRSMHETSSEHTPNPYAVRDETLHTDDGFETIPHTAHAFARESFIDEIADARAIDPLQYRLAHLDPIDDAGARELIDTLADRASWTTKAKRAGNAKNLQGRGFAFDKRDDAYSAWIVDLDVNRATGDVAIQRVVAGSAKGRRSIGAIAGMSSARIAAAASKLIGVRLDAHAAHDETPRAQPLAHRIETTALQDTPATREAPSIDTSPAAAAIANALYDATGVRFRAPPFTPERVRDALNGASAPGNALPRRMRRTLRGAMAATGLGGLVALACTAWPLRAPIASIAKPDASTWSQATIARGRDVAAAGDCAVCHTAPGGAVNAGGLGLETPFGTVYTTNITPDEKTGIGNWSFAAFDRAMRQGISRDGHHLYPAFPYTSFAKISDADMTALYAYLMSQPAVESTPPQTRLPFPLNQRGLVAGWNALYLKQGEYVPDATRSALWNRGKYLVDGAGHCGACHSPRNAIGAEKGGRLYLTGGSAEGWMAPSLVANSKLPVRWTEQALFDYLRTGFSHEHGVAAGPMAPVVSHLATLPAEDVRAMAHYVASLSPVAVETRAPSQPDALRLHALDNGRRTFDAACAVCHAQTGGVGNFGVRPLLSLNTSVSDASPDNLLHVILHGIDAPATDELGYMPGFKDSFDDRQVAELAAYIRAEFAPREPAWSGLAQATARIRAAGH